MRSLYTLYTAGFLYARARNSAGTGHSAGSGLGGGTEGGAAATGLPAMSPAALASRLARLPIVGEVQG